jgi:hypothetical protein
MGDHLTLLNIVTADTWEVLFDGQPIKFTKSERSITVELPISQAQHTIQLKKQSN